MNFEAFIAWAERNRSAAVRLTYGGGVTHTGDLSIQTTVGPNGSRTIVRVRDRRRARNQYHAVCERHLENGQFQFKDGARYRVITEEDLAS